MACEPAEGIEQAFAAELEASPSMWSQIKLSWRISDKVGPQIESHAKQPSDWLDQSQGSAQSDPAERISKIRPAKPECTG